MIRATTPIHSFLFRDNPSQYAVILITYSQGQNSNKRIVLEKTKKDLNFGRVTSDFSPHKGFYRAWYRLTQEETRKFKVVGGSSQILVQVRVLTGENEALASKKKMILLEDVLNDEILINPTSTAGSSAETAALDNSTIPYIPPSNGEPIVDIIEHGTQFMVEFDSVETSTFVERDYNDLINKPTINGKTLEGDMQSEDLHIEPDYPEGATPGGLLSWSSDGTATWITVASEPEEGSTRPISSGAVYDTIGNINVLLDTI